MNDYFMQGFTDRCAKLGVDPEKLIKAAQGYPPSTRSYQPLYLQNSGYQEPANDLAESVLLGGMPFNGYDKALQFPGRTGSFDPRAFQKFRNRPQVQPAKGLPAAQGLPAAGPNVSVTPGGPAMNIGQPISQQEVLQAQQARTARRQAPTAPMPMTPQPQPAVQKYQGYAMSPQEAQPSQQVNY